jgi:hypothetical protein
MIISRGRGYIFVHAPKTGGTALMLALEARAMKQDILIGDTPKARQRRRRLDGVKTRGRLWKHATLADIDGLITPDEAASLFVFTIVRNPWDRVVSYYHWLRTQTFAHPAVRVARETTFPDFLRHDAIAASFSAAPHAAYVTDAGGTERCGLYLRHERLAEDTALLADRLGLRLDLPTRVNVSARDADWRGYFTEADAAHWGEVCAVDMARFGYGFDPGAPQ